MSLIPVRPFYPFTIDSDVCHSLFGGKAFRESIGLRDPIIEKSDQPVAWKGPGAGIMYNV